MLLKSKYIQHFFLSLGILCSAAIMSSIVQYQSAMDYLWGIVLAVVVIPSLIFSLIFALIQVRLGQTILNTILLVSLLAIYIVFFIYNKLHLDINWNDVSEGRIKLTLIQQILKSDWSYWTAFILPWIISILIYMFRSKKITY